MTKQIELSNFKKMINSPDFSIISNVYFKISLKAFKECFTNITRFDKYFDKVYKSLLDIAAEQFDEVPKNELEEHLNVGIMIWIAERILRHENTSNCNEDTALFIIEKLLAEPLAILGKELHKNKNKC